MPFLLMLVWAQEMTGITEVFMWVLYGRTMFGVVRGMTFLKVVLVTIT